MVYDRLHFTSVTCYIKIRRGGAYCPRSVFHKACLLEQQHLKNVMVIFFNVRLNNIKKLLCCRTYQSHSFPKVQRVFLKTLQRVQSFQNSSDLRTSLWTDVLTPQFGKFSLKSSSLSTSVCSLRKCNTIYFQPACATLSTSSVNGHQICCLI